MKKFWPIIAIILVELVLVITNVPPHTILAGWDNLFPEFNFPLNTLRSIFGVWLEYRGTGLYDGMSHIANLVHTITLYLMSVVLPQELLRYVFNLGMHLAGGIGAYFLISHIVDTSAPAQRKIMGFIGALFYMLNLATVQMFFAPLEAYSVYFAALPWLTWALSRLYLTPTRTSYTHFLIISLLSTPAFFVTTLLLPIAILLGSLSLVYLLTSWRVYARRVVIAAASFFFINAFWLLPYLWGLPHNAPVIANAKINQMGSGEIFSRNQAFGDMQSVLKLRGFSLNFEDLNKEGQSVYMMEPWRNFIHTPASEVLMGLVAVIALVGLVTTLGTRRQRTIGFALTFIVCFVLLGTDVPGIREVTAWLQQTIPFFKEAFRFTFTKFGLPFALCYTVMVVAGIQTLIGRKPSTYLLLAVLTLVSSGIFFLSLPSFQGNFLYKNLRITIPNEYKELSAYTKTMRPNGRIAILPQPSYWSWKYYRFGYRGSGFMWMGIPQPIMDRAFDPWSKANEGYYWELSYALYSKNATLLQNVLTKYDVSYVILDENVLSFSNNRSLFIDETKELLAGIPDIQIVATFGNITLYEKTGGTSKDFVSMRQNLPTANRYTWTDNDTAYGQLGDYVTGEGGTVYPFRSLFTKRSVSEREFTVETVLPSAIPVYDSTKSADLVPTNVKQCGLLKPGSATASIVSGALRLESINQRGCLSFDIPDLSHKSGYLVRVESSHITGRPLMISFINDTARHVELETFLDSNINYFILPPLAPDGLGYTVYISNDAIGNNATINDLSRIRVYSFPYSELVSLHTGSQPKATALTDFTVSHPNPAFYTVVTKETGTIVLSQSYDDGWIAWSQGTILPHIMVDNWKNGWILNPGTNNTIYIFFWPQMLEILGFILLPIPFIIAIKQKK